MWTPAFFPRLTEWAAARLGALDYTFHPAHMFTLIGILASVYAIERAVDFALFHLARPRAALQAYKRRGPKPTYALITGGSAGIGLGIAHALVKQGFGVILLGHKAAELATAADALRTALVLDDDADPLQEYVHVLVLDAMTASAAQIEEVLRKGVVEPGLRVAVLVNNVGAVPIAHPPFRTVDTYSPEDIDRTIALNARFMARFTTLMLPVLTHRGAGVDAAGNVFGTHRRSLVLNVSSAGMFGVPWAVLYGATKAFNWGYSRGLARELEVDPATRHVDVLAIIPSDTRTETNAWVKSSWAPTAEAFGRDIVHKTDGALARGWREMYPNWMHHLESIAMGFVSEKTIAKAMMETLLYKKVGWEKWDAAQKAKGD